MAKENIVYIGLVSFEDGKVIRGGALVVDSTTEPLEFRCTDAVRPTMLQRVLWGKRLDGHIAANLLGAPLLNQLSQKYSLVVIKEPDFLELRATIQLPVVLLTKDSSIEFDEPEHGQSEDEADRAEEQERDQAQETAASESVLANTSGRYDPIVLKCHPAYKDDLETVRSLLAPVFATHDVMEPFERISTALNMVHQEKEKGK